MSDFRIVEKTPATNYNEMNVDGRMVSNDVTALIDSLSPASRGRTYKREDVLDAANRGNVRAMRAISQYFFRTSGIYARLCRYMAQMYRYDWTITPVVPLGSELDDRGLKRMVSAWYDASFMLERACLKGLFGDIALDVIRNGVYYGIAIRQEGAFYLQKLPEDWCRSRYEVNGWPVVELNVRYFDDAYRDASYRLRVLQMFPKEIQQGYARYKEGKLERDYSGDETGWIALDPQTTVRFTLGGTETPTFYSVIPHLLDLEEAQDLDKAKMAQQVLKIIVQQFPIDKNGDSVFDPSEVQQLHNNVRRMLGDSIGIKVMSTIGANVSVADTSDHGNVSSVDQLSRVERTVFNEAGVSQMQFNTSGNLALEKSILNDEGSLRDLIEQFQVFGQRIVDDVTAKVRRVRYTFRILPTTVYNYKDLSKLYKEQTMMGLSKLLPQVALGSYQTEVIASARFENETLNLRDLFVPPQLSSTLSTPSESEGGRPPLDVSDRAPKTIQNQESM